MNPSHTTIYQGQLSVSVLANGALLVDVPEDAVVRHRLAPTAKPEVEYVGVRFRNYNSPSEAASGATCRSQVYTYAALKSLKLTVGDRVEVPSDYGDAAFGYREATVVSLNETDPTSRVGYCKQIVGRA